MDNKIWTTRLSANAAYALAPGWGVRLNASGGMFEEPNFTIGVETGWWQQPVPNSPEDSSGVIALLTMRYWF